ncbi:MAG TPA: TetR family transcriptional regulator C-terminal domain-containing protein [Alphaproteobacteria bacterium]|jgi:TetR/AcrR family transcriptional repressor of bet genes|nr:TetR family transcriptional regulator C-terminal domain-containing protein [Alphaproteobacteria bacterium]
MAKTRKARAAPVPEKALHIRQRQRLIDASISALHLYGPSSTTIEKVVTIADMSPGIVNFYFDTKAAMLVAALEHLAVEFEREVLVPVGALRAEPARALSLLIDLYLDPELASPRKVSVWYAFWGEANSRSEYHDICGKKDEGFAALVQDLIGRLIAETGQSGLDADGVALGLIGALEILWQNIAFQDEAEIDRPAYKRRCRAYLRSVFPDHFADQPASGQAGLPRALESPYADPGRFAIERDLILFPAWHVAARDGDIAHAGDYVAFQLAGERILVVRGEDGRVHAFRNACAARPHALADGPAGHFEGGHIACGVDGRVYAFDGAAENGGHGLVPLQTTHAAGLIFVRLSDRDPPVPPNLAAIPAEAFPGLKQIAPADETAVAADWKLIAEFWLDSFFADGAVEAQPDGIAWRGTKGREVLFLFPGTMIRLDGDDASVVQVFGAAAGRSIIRRLTCGGRIGTADIGNTVAICESTQVGLSAPLYDTGTESEGDAPSRFFRDWIASRLPKAAGRL